MILKIGNKPYELATKEEVMKEVIKEMEDTKKEVIKEMEDTKKEVFDKLYPVGSVYISLDATFNPNNIYNGKWELLEKGRYLRATDEIDKVGQKVEAGVPDTYFYLYIGKGFGEFLYTKGGIELKTWSNQDPNAWGTGNYISGGSITVKASMSNSIYGNSDTVTPESIDAYIWKRIE